MTDTIAVRDHYQAAIEDRAALLARIAAAVDRLEPPIDARKLAPLDQFHMGGLAATAAVAERARPARGEAVLDAGSGLGGPARYLAAAFGCQVEGVDLSPDYVAIARLLTDRAGLSDRVSFSEGDLLHLPFDDARFDLVWAQHVAMNIADRAGLYRELRRVLKPGGRLVFYDPVAADDHPDLTYPVPWAQTARTSTLLTIAETSAALADAGFDAIAIDDVTEAALGWAAQQGLPTQGALNAGMVLGARMAGMAANFMLNLREGRVRLGLGVAAARQGAAA
jgi:SAM-dependent methyltransferase